jgi:hypothetical protein
MIWEIIGAVILLNIGAFIFVLIVSKIGDWFG